MLLYTCYWWNDVFFEPTMLSVFSSKRKFKLWNQYEFWYSGYFECHLEIPRACSLLAFTIYILVEHFIEPRLLFENPRRLDKVHILIEEASIMMGDVLLWKTDKTHAKNHVSNLRITSFSSILSWLDFLPRLDEIPMFRKYAIESANNSEFIRSGMKQDPFQNPSNALF